MLNRIKNYLNENASVIHIVGPLTQSFDSDPNEPTLFIDGGTKFKKDYGFSLGDNDSFQGELDYKLPKDKDFSDLQFALTLIPSQTETVYLHGFLGGRKDHELINLGEVAHFLFERNESKVVFDDRITAYSQGFWEFELQNTFTLFSFHENTLSLTGECKYQLIKQSLKPFSSHGLSNEAEGKISLHNSAPLYFFEVSK